MALGVARNHSLPHKMVLEDLRLPGVVPALVVYVSCLRRALIFRTCCGGVMVKVVVFCDSVAVLRVIS